MCLDRARRPHQIKCRIAALLLVIGLAGAARAAEAIEENFFEMSLEDLMNVEITSVSKHREKVSQAPAAVSVITQDDIHRSGMTSIAELLRLSPGLEVARVDANKWAITSRGFNDIFANKLLVLTTSCAATRTANTPSIPSTSISSIVSSRRPGNN
jgi:outer membrane receptor for ferrienterochelin and colicin